jgi:hypothetical protein
MQGATSAPAHMGRTNSSSADAELVGACTPARSLGGAGRLWMSQLPQHLREAVGEVPAEDVVGADACGQDQVSRRRACRVARLERLHAAMVPTGAGKAWATSHG